VLLIEYTNELRRRGLPLAEAVVRAGRTPLRPNRKNSRTTVCGQMPLARGWLGGGEANAPLARAVIGGLAVSTGFTLVLIPTVYTILEERFPRHLAPEEGGAT
jgi:multidrug efflux pump subunit AcrB